MTAPTQLETFMTMLLDRESMPGHRPFFVTCDSARSFRLADRLAARGIPHIDVGVCEALGIGVAAGLATEGYTPYVAAFAAFGVLRGAEALRTFVDAEHLPVTLLGGMAGLSAGRDGLSHHLLEDLALFRALDGVRVYTPSDTQSCEWAVNDLLAKPGPAYVRLARIPLAAWPGETCTEPMRWLTRSGWNTVVCGYGPQLLTAAEHLLAAGAPVDVLEIRRCQPLPPELPAALADRRVLVMEEHRQGGGLADRMRADINVPIAGLFAERSPGSGDYQELLHRCGLAGPALVRWVEELAEQAVVHQ